MLQNRLKLARENAGLSQRDVTDRLNLGANQVGRWERGENIPSVEMVTELARLYGVSLDYLVGLTENTNGNVGMDDLSILERRLILFARSGLLVDAMESLAAIAKQIVQKQPEAED